MCSVNCVRKGSKTAVLKGGEEEEEEEEKEEAEESTGEYMFSDISSQSPSHQVRSEGRRHRESVLLDCKTRLYSKNVRLRNPIQRRESDCICVNK